MINHSLYDSAHSAIRLAINDAISELTNCTIYEETCDAVYRSTIDLTCNPSHGATRDSITKNEN